VLSGMWARSVGFTGKQRLRLRHLLVDPIGQVRLQPREQTASGAEIFAAAGGTSHVAMEAQPT
jgi:hypothetical protein